MPETAKRVELIREGPFLAEVEVEIILDELGWSPGLTPAAIDKLERVRVALKAGDLRTALRYAKIYEIRPIAPGTFN